MRRIGSPASPRPLPPIEATRLIAALVILAAIVYYVQLFFLRTPHLGFNFDPRTWIVHEVFSRCEGPACLQRGDRLLRIGDITAERFVRNPALSLPDFRGDQRFEVEVLRGGVARTMVLASTERPLAERLVYGAGAVLLPLAFWLAGTAGLLFLRPLQLRGVLLVCCFYSLALLIAAGLSSRSHTGYSWYALVVSGWAFAPLSIHFHLSVPEVRFPRLHRWGVSLLYALAVWCLYRGLTDPVIDKDIAWALLAGITVAWVLLLYGWARSSRPRRRHSSRIMATGMFLGAAPMVLLAVVPAIATSRFPELSSSADSLLGLVAVCAMPVWPASYLYVVYRGQMPHLAFRANRLLGLYGFYALILAAVLSLQMVLVRLLLTDRTTVRGHLDRMVTSLVIVTALVAVATPSLRRAFQRWLDRAVFGLRYTAEEVLQLLAERIPTSLEPGHLRRVIRDEILPTLMIRRSALYLLRGNEVDVVDAPGEDPVPTAAELHQCLAVCAGGDPAAAPEYPESVVWARLILPIATGGERLGVWLLGGRDPDDSYPAEDVQLLESLANMIAAVARGQQAAIAKSRFLANVSHGIRTPMNDVLGMVDLLTRSELTPTQRELCHTIRANGETLLRLVDDILELAKMEHGRLAIELRPLDLLAVTESPRSVAGDPRRRPRASSWCSSIPRRRRGVS